VYLNVLIKHQQSVILS